ncbi:alpha/beta hydrolase [Phyllobacterium sp. SB3]|uniref:alpha/beta fold hydrolase n=1 Tax=Phyllobacterium sp. SB3 TaxID=3156073 RepID=UPI0032AF9DAF
MITTVRGALNTKLALSRLGEGRPVILQHGLCGDAAQPAQVFPFDEGHQCLTLECRGHGQSEAGNPSAFSIPAFTDDLATAIEDRRLGMCVVGGISMGAAMALRLTVTRPDLVSALILARPAWLTDPAPQNMAPNAYVGELLRDYPAQEARRHFETSSIAAELSRYAPDNLASLRSFFSREPGSVTSRLLLSISGSGPGITENDIRSITVPTLIVACERDMVHPIAYGRELASLIGHAQFVEITPKATNPDAYRNDFRAALSSFLKGL